MKRSSIQRVLTVLFASTFLFVAFKVDGRYEGELLKPLISASFLEMKDGVADIRLEDGTKISFGRYYKRQGSWVMDADGVGTYEMKAWLGGFDLIRATNSVERYRFTKTYFTLPDFIDPD